MANSAFAGLKLTAATPAPVVPMDQRLFAPTLAAREPDRQPAPAPPSAPPRPTTISANAAAPAEVGKEAKRERGEPLIPLEAARSERPLTEPAAKTMSRFDINEKPYRKDSFLFTDAEFDRLEDFKLELRRRFDLKATKNDIARAAFHHLYEDYSREPQKSAVVRQLRAKKA